MKRKDENRKHRGAREKGRYPEMQRKDMDERQVFRAFFAGSVVAREGIDYRHRSGECRLCEKNAQSESKLGEVRRTKQNMIDVVA